MSLADIWFGLFVVIIAGYVILDGFDLGVGMLYPFVSHTDVERRLVLNSIGPVWDGNEVWLVLGGGALFAAFPLVYASLFSGFYLAMMLVLLVLILRGVAIEFRSKRAGQRWRRTWDWFFSLSSLGIALLLGVAFGNIIQGVPLDQQGNINVSLVDLLGPYPLALGVTGALMLALHGCIYLTLKLEDDLLARVERLMPRLMAAFFVAMTVLVGWTLLLGQEIPQNFEERPWTVVFPLAAFGAALLSWRMIRRKEQMKAFLLSGTMIALLVATAAAGLYPVLLPSSLDVAYDLTVSNASSADETLQVMLVIAVIGIPFVLLYTAGVYWFFRGKVRLDDHSY